jgi:hypothetical protein
VKYTEHSWKNSEDGREGFIDLVLQDAQGTMSLAVECKRRKDAQWIFLMPDPKQMQRRHVKAWVTWSGSDSPKYFGWRDVTADPRTPQSQFRIVRGEDSKAKPMLEAIGSELVSATEAFAGEERPALYTSRENLRVYFSVIVTTAKLYTCEFDPASIPLSTGAIPNGRTTEVAAVRFRKQLAVRMSERDLAHHQRPHDVSLAKEHTVFVVNAERFIEFLNELEIDSTSVEFLA